LNFNKIVKSKNLIIFQSLKNTNLKNIFYNIINNFFIKFFYFLFISIFFLYYLQTVNAQQLKNKIRGVVIDADSRSSLIGATIILTDINEQNGTISDTNGKFCLENVTVGRHNLKASFMGYGEVILNNLEVVSGKEIFITIEMHETAVIASEVVVTAKSSKSEATNKMATISARAFTVEETSRYAGSWGDPSRMASKFAGVTIVSDERNDIIVRGNSPIGMLWRLDGVDIPNPNHFAVAGSSGGAISMINNNLLDNSDFFTSAFPAEYGNALSAVFDLHLRNGNNEKHEYFAQVGVNGFEIGAEGPFTKFKKSSYLFSYRYSTLAVLNKLGISIIDAVPVFQDVSFKFNFPLKEGRLSIFGVAGTSKAVFEPVLDSLKWEGNNDYISEKTGSKMGVIAISYFRPINNYTYFRIILSLSADNPFYTQDSAGAGYLSYRIADVNYLSERDAVHTLLNSRINSRLKIKGGIIFNRLLINNNIAYYHWKPQYKVFTLSSIKGSTLLEQAYIQAKYALSAKFSINSGINTMCLFLNKTFSFQPRVGVKYEVNSLNSFSFGFGYHSQIQPLPVYFVQKTDSLGKISYPNKNLKFINSMHFVFGYDRQLNEFLRVKSEIYYQQITDAALGNQNPVYSLLNFGGGDDIVTGETFNNNGKGNNYGIELTVERFFNKGWYFLSTGSLFNSKYLDGNNKWRNTRYNTNYVFNLLGGKEFKTGLNNSLGISATVVNIGGQRYIPIDLSASELSGNEIRIDSLAYQKQFEAYFRVDLRLRYRLNHKHFSQEIAFELGNIFNRKNINTMYYDKYSEEIKYSYQLPRIPLLFYRVEF